LAELDAAIGTFIVKVYNHRVHSETGQPPQARWEAGGFLPHLPESLEQLRLRVGTEQEAGSAVTSVDSIGGAGQPVWHERAD
jgi:hypothetical protein